MFDGLKTSIREQDFHPRLLGLLVNPFYFARKGLLQHIVELAPSVRGRLLDVGCGSKPYQKHFEASEYIGLDMQGRTNKSADYYYDGKVFPFKDDEFDAVLTSEVLEHVFNPDTFLSEINRVLRDGGILLLTALFAPLNVIGELLAKVLPGNSDLYLDNIILARGSKNSSR
jgi:ubiquinone/menaquinone biosynthesis C-methylase UbiE